MLVITLREGETVTVQNKATGEEFVLAYHKRHGKQIRVAFKDPRKLFQIKRSGGANEESSSETEV